MTHARGRTRSYLARMALAQGGTSTRGSQRQKFLNRPGAKLVVGELGWPHHMSLSRDRLAGRSAMARKGDSASERRTVQFSNAHALSGLLAQRTYFAGIGRASWPSAFSLRIN